MGYVVGKVIALILASAGIIHLVNHKQNFQYFIFCVFLKKKRFLVDKTFAEFSLIPQNWSLIAEIKKNVKIT